MSNKGNPVDSSIWRHLPSDKTLREFRREYQQTTNREKEPSVTWVKDSLNQISEDNPIVENLFRNYAEVVGHHNTYPVLIPLETAELLSTILETRDSNKKAKGEDFAAEILRGNFIKSCRTYPHETFYVMNGNRALIKRAKFEEYLDQATAV